MPHLVEFPSKKPARKQKRRNLSATTLKALTPPASGSVDYFDDLTPGLSLRVTASDVRTWAVFYRDQPLARVEAHQGRDRCLALVEMSESRFSREFDS